MLILTSRRSIMGHFSNHRLVSAVGGVIVSLVLALNAYLLWSLVI
ncbi:hypothetical protein JCM19238_641 [Vibrio ponticus]|nr:hypothetical protein JCM19238_641 [Vibrio ponticus]